MDSWSEEALNWLVSGMPGPVRWRDIQRAWAMAAEQAKKHPVFWQDLYQADKQLNDTGSLNNPGFSYAGVKNTQDPFRSAADEQRLRILGRIPERYMAEPMGVIDVTSLLRNFYRNNPAPPHEGQSPMEDWKRLRALATIPHYVEMHKESSAPPGMVLTRFTTDSNNFRRHFSPGYIFNDPTRSSWTHAPSHTYGEWADIVYKMLPMKGGENFYPVGNLQDEWTSPRHQNLKVVSVESLGKGPNGQRLQVNVIPWGEDPSAVMLGQPKPVPAVQNYRLADPEASRWSFKNGQHTYNASGRVYGDTVSRPYQDPVREIRLRRNPFTGTYGYAGRFGEAAISGAESMYNKYAPTVSGVTNRVMSNPNTQAAMNWVNPLGLAAGAAYPYVDDLATKIFRTVVPEEIRTMADMANPLSPNADTYWEWAQQSQQEKDRQRYMNRATQPNEQPLINYPSQNLKYMQYR